MCKRVRLLKMLVILGHPGVVSLPSVSLNMWLPGRTDALLTSACMRAALVECPDADFMCSDPGALTCTDELNDCNGRGDCYQGD